MRLVRKLRNLWFGISYLKDDFVLFLIKNAICLAARILVAVFLAKEFCQSKIEKFRHR